MKELHCLFYIDRSAIIFIFFYLSTGYHDTGAYPAPTFYNPIPWHPIPIPKTQKTERPKSRTRSKKYVWNPQKYFWVFFLITIDCESAPTSIVCMYAFECRYQDLFQKSFSDIRYLFQVLDIRTFRFGKCVFTLKHGSPHLPICCVIFLF